jgi:hypothetical protein
MKRLSGKRGVIGKKGRRSAALHALVGIIDEQNVRLAERDGPDARRPRANRSLATMMTTSSHERTGAARSLSERDARVMAAAPFRVKRRATAGCKESSMVFLLTLLGSMIVCEALFCGDLQRLLATTARAVRLRQEHVSLIVIAACAYGVTGRDYRWE